MVKRLFITLIIFFNIFVTANAGDSIITPNIKGGEYNYAIEIYLNSNTTADKIYYYFDKNSRFYDILEYSNSPILLKKDTTLSFFGAKSREEATTVYEEKYTFNYPKNIELSYNDGKIIITNQENETINLGYWNIIGNNLNKIIPKNSFLNSGESYYLDYNISKKESIDLYSPDSSVDKKYTYNPITETKTQNTNKITLSSSKIEKVPVDYSDVKTHEVDEISFNDILGSAKSSITEYKSQTSEEKNDTKSGLLIWFAVSIFIIIIHSFFLNIKRKKISKLKNKKN